MDYLSNNIAANLKKIRTSRGISLDVAAEQTGVSKSMLHRIEKGRGNPSINVLGKIASGLRIEFIDLIASPKEENLLIDIAKVAPTKEQEGEYKVWTCFPYEDNKNVEIYRIDIEQKKSYSSGGHGENTREYIAVIKGELTLQTGDSLNIVKENQIFRFNTETDHRYINSGDEKLSLICIFVAE